MTEFEHVHSNGPDAEDCTTCEADPENFQKVAYSNEWLGEPPKGSCKTCGCLVDQMPMIFRGTGWCSDRCRKAQQDKD